MICVGSINKKKELLDNLIEQHFPGSLTSPDVVKAALEYERIAWQLKTEENY